MHAEIIWIKNIFALRWYENNTLWKKEKRLKMTVSFAYCMLITLNHWKAIHSNFVSFDIFSSAAISMQHSINKYIIRWFDSIIHSSHFSNMQIMNQVAILTSNLNLLRCCSITTYIWCDNMLSMLSAPSALYQYPAHYYQCYGNRKLSSPLYNNRFIWHQSVVNPNET